MGDWAIATVDGSEMRMYVAKPSGDGPHPAVLVMFHRTGMDAFTMNRADKLAEAGFYALAPDFYHRHPDLEGDGPAEFRNDKEFIADITAALDYLREQPDVDFDRLGILGHCMGGRTAFFGASVFPDTFKACVVYYGGGMFSAWGDGPTAFERLDDLKCPVLGNFGALDTNPSPDDVARFAEKLTANGVEHVFHMYEGANHAFEDPNNKRGNYNKEASEIAWPRSMKFLQEKLG